MHRLKYILSLMVLVSSPASAAAPAIPFTVTMSEPVTIGACAGTACPYLALTVDTDTTKRAYCPQVTNSATVTCTYTAVAGDLDLDGLTFTDTNLHSNSIAITDQNGNPVTNFAFTPPANMSSVKLSYPSLSMDFTNGSGGRYTLNGTTYTTLASFLSAAGGTFTRASTGTYFDSAGTLQVAATNTPRFDYNPSTLAAKGILIEEGRTNYVKNSQFSGIPVGTSSSTGSWQLSYGSPPGSSISVTGTGTQNGIPYIDIRYLLPTNATGGTQWPSFGMLFSDAAVVSNGDKTIFSSWFGITSYSSTGGTCSVGYSNRSYTSGGAYITEATTAFTSTTSYTYRATPVMTHGATAGKSYFAVYVAIPNGASCDITIRLGGPQFELGSFPTSLIPTTSAAVTRAAESLSFPTSGWYQATAHTLYSQSMVLAGNTNYGIIVEGENANKGVTQSYLPGGAAIEVNAREYTGVNSYSGSTAVNPAGTSNKFALAQNSSGPAFTANGTSLTPNHSPGTLGGPTSLYLGSRSYGDIYLNGWIQGVKFYPQRASNTQLQLLTQ